MAKYTPSGERGQHIPLPGIELFADTSLNIIKIKFPEVQKMLDEGGQILDLGTGNGQLLKSLEQEGVKAIGIDYNKIPSVAPDKTVRADAHKLPFADNSFAAVLTHGMFDEDFYDNDVNTIFSEVARVLKPNGLFVCPTEETSKCSAEILEKFNVTPYSVMDLLIKK